MKIKKVIGYTLIALYLCSLVYFYATQVPWYAILALIGLIVVMFGFIALLAWLLKDDKKEDKL